MSHVPTAPERARSATEAGQACRECRRRKGKCDGRLPVCSVCQKYNRHCLYDKHSRSALTRKHLTEVEERLERAETLLRAVFSEPELARMLGQGLHKDQASQLASAKSASIFDTSLSTIDSPRSYDVEASTTETTSYFHTPTPAPTAGDSSLLENSVPTAADDDFEWDESEALWSPLDAGTKTSTMSGTDAAALRKITDGMATLSADDPNTGFLGAVSGAALLHLISVNKGSDQKGGTVLELGDKRRSSIVDLLEMQLTETSPADSWLAAQPIMNRAFVDTLVDTYFAHYHTTFPILHEPTFRQHYQTLNDRPKGIWHTLAQLVAALGAFVSSNCPDTTDISLFNAVKSQLTIDTLETGSLGLVQAFAMAANYLQKRNRPNSGYNYGGIALRSAISLGLHQEFQTWQTALVKKEIRRRVWWSLCILDVGATITYGRPLNWPQAGVSAQFPLNIHDTDLTVTSTSLPNERNEATLYSYVRTQSAYHLSTISIYNRLISSSPPSALELTTLDDKSMERWLHELPSYYSDVDLPLSQEYLLGQTISRCRYRIMRIIMYRPFFLRWAQDGLGLLDWSKAEHIATSRCLRAAEECITVLARFWTIATHTRLSACSSHAGAADWIRQVHTALNVINTMVEINPSALKCKDIILRLCGDLLFEGPTAQDQPVTGATTSDSYFPNPSRSELEDFNVDTWMQEIDTAVSEYKMYCDRLTSTAVPTEQDFASGQLFSFTNRGIGDEPGELNWDWGLSLMQ